VANLEGGGYVFQIDLKSRKAIYEQVMENFKRLIITGVLRKDEKVPSVRDMAKALTVNPNTIQKAYRELESQGYFYTVLGQGNYIAAPPPDIRKKEALYEGIRSKTQELIFYGEKKADIIQFIEAIPQMERKNGLDGADRPDEPDRTNGTD